MHKVLIFLYICPTNHHSETRAANVLGRILSQGVELGIWRPYDKHVYSYSSLIHEWTPCKETSVFQRIKTDS